MTNDRTRDLDLGRLSLEADNSTQGMAISMFVPESYIILEATLVDK